MASVTAVASMREYSASSAWVIGPAAPPDIKDHHIHHVAQVGLQSAVIFGVTADQIDQHPFLGAQIIRGFASITGIQQGLLAIDKGDLLRAWCRLRASRMSSTQRK